MTYLQNASTAAFKTTLIMGLFLISACDSGKKGGDSVTDGSENPQPQSQFNNADARNNLAFAQGQ